MRRTALALLLLFATAYTQDPQPRYSLNPDQSSKRYQFFFSPFARSDAYYLDTARGRVWQVTERDGTTILQRLQVQSEPFKDPPVSSIEAILGRSTTEPPQVGAPPTGNGRFVLIFSPHARAETFLVDNASGSVWQMVLDKEKKQLFQRTEFDNRP